MADERFTNREIKLMFDSIEDKLDDIRGGMGERHDTHSKEITELKASYKAVEKQVTTWKAYVTVIGGIVSLFGLPTIIQFIQSL